VFEKFGGLEKMEKTQNPEHTPKLSDESRDIFGHLFQDDFVEGGEKNEASRDLKNKEKSSKEERTEAPRIYEDMFAEDFESLSKELNGKIEDDAPENENNEEQEEYDEEGTRELTDEEKEIVKEATGWSDKKIDENCRIDKDGVIHYKTDCQDKEGQRSECGVLYERKRFEYNGIIIEGVFPVFDSAFDTQLSEEDYKSSSGKQFNECNKALKKAIENNPELKEQFTKEQLEDIENGRTPRGYTWHHAEEPGKMQLVKTEDHDRRVGGAAHTGGNSIWGNKSVEKAENDTKGESF